jgi:hypothetical protein
MTRPHTTWIGKIIKKRITVAAIFIYQDGNSQQTPH